MHLPVLALKFDRALCSVDVLRVKSATSCPNADAAAAKVIVAFLLDWFVRSKLARTFGLFAILGPLLRRPG